MIGARFQGLADAITRNFSEPSLPPSLWQRIRKAFRPDEPARPFIWLTMIGGRGRGSAQARMRRDSTEWVVEDGKGWNARVIPLPHAPHSSHWIITDQRGMILHEGRLRRALEGCEIPVGAICIHED